MAHHHENWQLLDDGDGNKYCGACGAPVPLQEIILEVIKDHGQSVRSKRCGCGWRPDYTKSPSSELFPAHSQHREHLAEEIAKRLKELA